MTVTELIGHLQALELLGHGNDQVSIADNAAGRSYEPSSVSYNVYNDTVEISID